MMNFLIKPGLFQLMYKASLILYLKLCGDSQEQELGNFARIVISKRQKVVYVSPNVKFNSQTV